MGVPVFKENERRLTLGVEMEFQVLDAETGVLTPRAPELLQILNSPRLEKEFFMSTLEIVTGVCKDMHEAVGQLEQELDKLTPIAESMGMAFASTGTHPFGDYNETIITPTGRYYELVERSQWVTRRMAVYGMHIHIGVLNGDEGIRLNNFLVRTLPMLLALSASSPFWCGLNTGLAACRPTTYESHPTAGLPYMVNNWSEFQQLYASMLSSNSIQSMKDLWWDIRPSPGYGTIEIRICDMPATLQELKAIGALVHLLSHWYFEQTEFDQLELSTPPMHWILRENKWRAIRYGLDASLVTDEGGGSVPLSDLLQQWLHEVAPFVSRYGYDDEMQHVKAIVEHGGSSKRQLQAYARHGSIHDVIRKNIDEFRARKPLP